MEFEERHKKQDLVIASSMLRSFTNNPPLTRGHHINYIPLSVSLCYLTKPSIAMSYICALQKLFLSFLPFIFFALAFVEAFYGNRETREEKINHVKWKASNSTREFRKIIQLFSGSLISSLIFTRVSDTRLSTILIW